MAPVCAVVVAGGSGQRFGNPGGKQLVNVAGRPLMSWSIRAFDRSDKVGHIVVVCPAERRAEMRRLAIDPFDYDTPISFADAGDTRQDSTRAGVHAVPAGFEYVAIHDGARPLITTEAIDHAIDVLVSDRALDGVVCGQPAIDTLKIVDGDNIVETPPRELYWAAQTPQIFSVDAMHHVDALGSKALVAGEHDIAAVLERTPTGKTQQGLAPHNDRATFGARHKMAHVGAIRHHHIALAPNAPVVTHGDDGRKLTRHERHLHRNGNVLDLRAVLVALDDEVIGRKRIEIVHVGVKRYLGRRKLRTLDKFADDIDMTVVNVGIGNHVQQLAGNHIDRLRDHHQQNEIGRAHV